MQEYKIGQQLNIGYYGGFHNKTLLKRQAKIVDIDNITGLIHIKVEIDTNVYRTMFGYSKELKVLEKNYLKK